MFGSAPSSLTRPLGPRTHKGDSPKIHAPTDERRRPLAFLLGGGQVADTSLDAIPATTVLLHGDKGYDGDAVRRKIENKGAAPNIPPKINKKWKNCFSPFLHRNRNAVERMVSRLKDFRRIATRYDRLARNFLASVHLAAVVAYRL